MTRAQIKETTQNVVIPASVALGVLALAAKALGFIPSQGIDTGVTNRLIAVEVRQVEMERQHREDRNEMLRILMDMQGSIRRIEGKLEK